MSDPTSLPAFRSGGDFLSEENLKLMAGYKYAWGELLGSDTEINTGSWQLAIRTYF